MTGLPISTRGLVHVYRTEGHDVAALAGVDLSVAAGRVIALLGPSGAGKSTLLQLLGGLFRPSAGRIRIGDHELTKLSRAELDDVRARHVAMLVQGGPRNLLPYLSPRQNVGLAQRLARRRGTTELPDADDLLGRVGLAGRVDTRTDRLSPADKQLAAIAAAAAGGPGVLLADEPTSQLDHHARDAVLDVLNGLSSELGTTVVLVTHDPYVAEVMPRTVTIRDGRIGGEGRSGQEYAVVTADGSLPLPAHALDTLPPGTLVHVVDHEDGVLLQVVDDGDHGVDGGRE
jgi:ABC-type lipoprotein export system ATPase subunit